MCRLDGHGDVVHQTILIGGQDGALDGHAIGHDVLLEHLQVDNASVTVFSYEDGCWKLLKWNYTGAL